MAKQYINPFHPETDVFSQALDECLDNSDWEKQREIVDSMEKRIEDFDEISQAKIYYCLGTTYGSIADREPDIKNVNRQYFYYQKSINSLTATQSDFENSLPYIRGLFLPLYTNYANLLDLCGRKIPAIKYYLAALSADRNFSMALGNLGKAYHHYALLMWDHVPRDYFNHCAYIYLDLAIEKNKGAYPEALRHFRAILDRYNTDYIDFLENSLDMGTYSYTGDEGKYREWAMQHGLFLNPLNDLPFHDFYIATDDIHLPDMIVKIDAKPVFHGLYNQLKQEYVFSRFLFYESLQQFEKPHYADKETCLFQFADYPSYSVRVEKMKTAFRIVYSLFDKIGFFLNQYFELGIAEKDIYFRKVWRDTRINKNDSFNSVLKPNQNFALNPLQWISRELFASPESTANPSAGRINDIRNALEHKYVKVYNDFFPARVDGEIDDLAFYLSETELEAYTYELLVLAREALINLSISVHIEEMKKKEKTDSTVIAPAVPFLHYDDEWKI